MIITTKIEIPPRRIADLMVTAIEGGINYWCKEVKCLRAHGVFYEGGVYKSQEGKNVKLVGVVNRGTSYETMIDEADVHRYTARDFGRVTGTTDDPRSLVPPIWYDQEAIYNDGPLLIEVIEHDSHKEDAGIRQLDLAKMQRGFELMQEFGKPKGYCWRDFLNENEDAITADVWFQLSVFGEVVYGRPRNTSQATRHCVSWR